MIVKIILCIVILFTKDTYMKKYNEIELIDTSSIVSISTMIDGNVKKYDKDSIEYNKIMDILISMASTSLEMPAYGVSLDPDTREAMKSGIWLEIEYDDTYTHNEMPFSKILINVEKDYRATNLIRYYDGKYSGRCFHLNFDSDMSKLYDAIYTM